MINQKGRLVMKIKNLRKLSDENFRRVIGVKRETFSVMLMHLNEAEKTQKSRGGRPNKLSMQNRLLMTLEYLREYRTYAAIAVSYGLTESNVYKNIIWVESVLIKCEEFKLPGKKALLKSDHEFEIILIDVAESPIERPKKNNVDFTQGKRSVIR
jgi:hypothetical protein